MIKNADYTVGKSLFKLPTENDVVTSKSSGESEKVLTTKAPETDTVSEAAYVVSSLTGDIVPKKDPVFVSFGNYPDVKSIIKSKMFYPVFITGLSGNGKTMGVTQACAENKRELIRVNITIETDEDDLQVVTDLKMVKPYGKWLHVIEAWKEVQLFYLTR